MPHPWDPLPDEPAAAYRRFLVYRELGPARSLAVACRLGAARGRPRRKGTKGNKRPTASGQWKEDSTRFDWPARALAWDIAQIATQGQRAAVGFITALEQYTLKVVEGLEDLPRPHTWEEMTEALHVLSVLIPPEVLQALRPDAGAGRLPERNGTAGGPGRLPG